MPSIERELFGEWEGREVWRTTLRSDRGFCAKIIDYGAAVSELWVPDAKGDVADVVLGFDTLPEYLASGAFVGATVGRVANRIGGGKFELDGKAYELDLNDPPHHLHGGARGWDRRVWASKARLEGGQARVRLDYVSDAGDGGYPGRVKASVVYTLTGDTLRIDMTAETAERTLVNLAHHSYWNLAGHGAGPIVDQELTLHADELTPGAPLVPDGRVESVAGGAFDFRTPKRIGKDIDSAVAGRPGYDHNFIVRGAPSELRPVARVVDPASGRVMDLSANQPGVQFYSGNYLDGSLRGKGATYGYRSALCLETQAFPNAINVPGWQGQVLLSPGEAYSHVMLHRFSVC